MNARWLILVPALLCAQGTAPKSKPSEYPVHKSFKNIEIGAEYLLHSIPGPKGMLFAPNHLVVEVAIYSTSPEPLTVRQDDFSLHVNGKKLVLVPQSPGLVAYTIKYPDIERTRNLEIDAGLGNSTVTLGRRPAPARFPGDPRPEQQKPPNQPAQATVQDVGKEAPSIDELVAAAALPEGESRLPVSGVLFFSYDGKLQSIHTLDLVYRGSSGRITLPLL